MDLILCVELISTLKSSVQRNKLTLICCWIWKPRLLTDIQLTFNSRVNAEHTKLQLQGWKKKIQKHLNIHLNRIITKWSCYKLIYFCLYSSMCMREIGNVSNITFLPCFVDGTFHNVAVHSKTEPNTRHSGRVTV